MIFWVSVLLLCSSYSVHLERVNHPPSQTLPAIHADFDNDGIEDVITPSAQFFYFYGLTVRSGTTGALLFSIGSGPEGFNGYSIVSFNADGSYPSIVFAVYRYDPSVPTGFAPTAQKVAVNASGTWTIRTLPVNLPGRDVACTRGYPGRANPVCFFAGYMDYSQNAGTSKLMEVHPDGTVTDMTFAAGLPFPSFVSNGRFMIGATWLDFSGDGILDLVAVGQHSQILTARTNANGTMTHSWIGSSLDYMRAFHFAGDDLPFPERPPCVYLAMEPGAPGNIPDFIVCFNRMTSAWYNPTKYSSRLPVEWSYEQPVRFWRWANQQTVFAANNAGTLNLYSMSCN